MDRQPQFLILPLKFFVHNWPDRFLQNGAIDLAHVDIIAVAPLTNGTVPHRNYPQMENARTGFCSVMTMGLKTATVLTMVRSGRGRYTPHRRTFPYRAGLR
jgi:hypothetical protein